MANKAWTWDRHPRFCKSGQHVLTRDNIIVRMIRRKPSLNCKSCYIENEQKQSAKRAEKRGYDRRMCRKQRHRLTRQNSYISESGLLVCRSCERANAAAIRERNKHRYTHVKCDAIGCTWSTERLVRPRWYLCRRHRQDPPKELLRLAAKEPELAALVRDRTAAA